MRKGTLNFNNDELYPKTSADMVTYSDSTVADALQNISTAHATNADFATRAENDENGNNIAATYAPIDSPNFTGTPTAPAINDLDLNTNQIATVQFANALIQRLTGVVPEELDTFEELYNALGQDSDIANTIATQIDAKQDQNNILTALSNLDLSAGKLIYISGENSFSLIDCSATGQAVISKTTPKEIRKMLGVYRNQFYDECENTWAKYNSPYISSTNAKFGKALQTNGGGIYSTAMIPFGGADFTIAFFARMDTSTGTWGMLFSAGAPSPDGSSRPHDIALVRCNANDSLTFAVTDSTAQEVVNSGEINFDPTDGLHYYEIDYHHATQTIELFGDNQLIYSASNITVERVERYVALGLLASDMTSNSIASIDEFTLLDGVARSSGSCTVPTEPFEVTENTLSLLHFA